MWTFLLAGCAVELTGSVTDLAGAPVEGARVQAEGCEAVSAADGSFRVRCERALHRFAVSHPAYAGASMEIDATGLLSPEPESVMLRAWPTEPGLYIEPDYRPVPAPGLARTATAEEQRYCLPAGAEVGTAPAGTALFDVHEVEWRLYRLDEEGCALRLHTRDGGTYWSPTATRVELAPVELATGHFRVPLPAEAGRYVAVPWMEGFFVPRAGSTELWEAWAFAIEG